MAHSRSASHSDRTPGTSQPQPVPAFLSDRQPWIDLLRGLAIILMIPANLSPYLAEPHAMWYRVFGSYAAPVFIALSAGLVRLRGDRHSFRYYLERGALVVLVGMLLDVLLWNIAPWTSFDVLYVIGIAMPIMYVTRRFAASEMFLIAAIFFVGAYVLQHVFGYHAEVLEVYFSEPFVPEISRVLQSALIDGWFPMFPWLGFAFLGSGLFASFSRGSATVRDRHVLASGLGLLAVGAVLLIVPIPGIESIADGTVLESRGGYSEIFYPATPGYILTGIGAFLLFSWCSARVEHANTLTLFAFFGRHSLMVYIMHQVLGVFLVQSLIDAAGMETIESGPIFTLANLLVIGIIAVLGALLDRIPPGRTPRLLFLRMLMGR